MNLTPRVFSFLAILILSSFTALHSQTDNLHAIAEQLRAIDTRVKGYPSGDVSPTAQRLLPQFKSGLRAIIGRTLNNHHFSSPGILRDLLLADLKTMGIEALSLAQEDAHDSPEGGSFGYLDDVTVRQPTRHPDLLAVVTTLAIPCGSDSSLNLYRRNGATWQLILVAESNGYADITGAQGSFQFVVSPPDDDGNPMTTAIGLWSRPM